MTALLPEWVLKNMIQVARGRVKRELLKYRININNAPADLPTLDNLLDAVAEPYPVWLLDAVEADKMLRRQNKARVDNELPVPRVLQLYIAEATPVQRCRGRPLDRAREFENVKLRAKVEITKLFMSRSPHRFPPGQRHEQALERVAEKCGMTRDALSVRIYPRKRRKRPAKKKALITK